MAGTVSTYAIQAGAAKANAEDVVERISMISPTDTPVVATHGRSEARDIRHYWLTDALVATSTAGTIEGADWASGSYNTRTQLDNVTQIFTRPVRVTNTQRAVMPYGVDDEYKYQVMKAGRELFRNVEVSIWKTSGAASSTGTTGAARVMRGIDHFLTKARKIARHLRSWGEGVTAGASGTGSATSITEDRFNGMLEYLFHVGANPDVIYVSANGKKWINDFTGPSGTRRTIPLADKRLVASVDLYDTEFGPMEITLNRWVRRSANTASDQTSMVGMMYALERALVKIAVLRPVKHVPMPPQGDSTRGWVIGELTLEVLNPTGCGRAWGVDNYYG